MACENDFDCVVPGALCYPGGVSWNDLTNGTNFCDCNHFFGFTADDVGTCTERNATTRLLLAVISIELVAALVFFLLGAFDVGNLAFSYGRSLKLNATLLTAVSTTLGLLCYVSWRITNLQSITTPNEFNNRLTDDADAEKLAYKSLVQRPFVFFAILFMVVSCLNVSVVWVEIASRARSMNVRVVSNVSAYRRKVLALELLFAITMAVIAATGAFGLAVVVCMPFVLVIGVAFVVGRQRMIKLLAGAISLVGESSDSADPSEGSVDAKAPPANPASSGRAAGSFVDRATAKIRTGLQAASSSNVADEGSAARRTRRAMVLIRKTSLHMIVAICLLVFFGVLYFLLNTDGVVSEFGNKEFANPDFSAVTVAQMGVDASVLYIFIVLGFYSHRNSTTLAQRQRGIVQKSSFHASSSNDHSKMPTSFAPSALAAPSSPSSVEAPEAPRL